MEVQLANCVAQINFVAYVRLHEDENMSKYIKTGSNWQTEVDSAQATSPWRLFWKCGKNQIESIQARQESVQRRRTPEAVMRKKPQRASEIRIN